MKKFEKGSLVSWNWGKGSAKGTVKESYTSKVSRQIKGTEVTRNASGNEPAYLVEQEGGDEALKSHSELESAS